MSLFLQGRGVFGFSVGGLGILGCRTLGCAGSQGRVPTTFCLPSSFVADSDSPSELLPHFRQVVSSVCVRERLADEGCHRTGILGTRFLQPFVCYTEGHWWLTSSHRSFSPQQICPPFSFSHGNLPVSLPLLAPRGLDDFHRPSGRLPPGSSPPVISEIPQVLSWPSDLPNTGSLLWSFIRSASFHPCHGPRSPPLCIVLAIGSCAI